MKYLIVIYREENVHEGTHANPFKVSVEKCCELIYSPDEAILRIDALVKKDEKFAVFKVTDCLIDRS